MLQRKLFWSALILGLLTPLAVACGSAPGPGEIDGYVALVPRVMRPGETEAVALSLFAGDRLAEGNVRVSLTREQETLLETSAPIQGKGSVELKVPPLESGEYQIVLSGPGFEDSATVRVQQGTLLFLESDKPIYKPGQTVHIRVVALNSELRPVSTQATVEVQDAKGIKVFKQEVATDEFGMADLELPLSPEPNLGVWKISTSSGDSSTDIDIRVEEYVLPKYEVKVELPKEWFLVDEPISGHVTARYSFGKPVRGELRVTASRYVGQWEEFATFSAPIDGEADFQVRAADFVAGVPEAGGLGNVTLEVAVVERATGYEESTTELVTVAATPVNVQVIPEGPIFKPSLPFGLLLVTQSPDGQPVEAQVEVQVTYQDENYAQVGEEQQQVETKRGTALLRLTPPAGAVTMTVSASSGEAHTVKEIAAGYSPSGNFIHVEQLEPGLLAIGDRAAFRVWSTSEASRFYYEVVARGRMVFTGYSESPEISFSVTPAMAPAARLLVYQILPNSEVAADFVPFEVQGQYPHQVSASFSVDQARPGDEVRLDLRTEGPARVGLAAVDRSVFILAENRLNLQQVFAELERLYMQPRAELHEAEPLPGPIIIPGARETFQDAGLTVLSNKRVPEGKELERPTIELELAGDAGIPAEARQPAAQQEQAGPMTGAPLAEVQRVRQFFPETWVWDYTTTDEDGGASLTLQAPDSITTWDLRAVAISPEKGLGIAEASLQVFQPFFLQVDLPYSAIRGEEFPVKVALYNYLETPQEILVEIEPAPWFDLLEPAAKTVTVAGNDIGGVEFKIRPKEMGSQLIKVTARSGQVADALIKGLIVEAEGVPREEVENAVLSAGSSLTLDLSLPEGVVPGSGRAYLAVTGSFLAQTIQGLDQLLQMPFGCGEQNMILFAPDVFILKYLKQTDQLKPEIAAKAETLLITGYQRELTYRRSDGSFSAFGEQDPEGSLFLTAFVLKTFAQAKGLIFIDDAILADAAAWIEQHQQPDGSFEAVGFLAHQELMGGVQGKEAMTAYVAIALLEAGRTEAASRAVAYLEGRLEAVDDPYTLAILTYALELGESPRAGEAYDKLMAAAQADEDGLHWGGGGPEPRPVEEPGAPVGFGEPGARSSDIEATGYATLALIRHGDQASAAQAARWLVAHRNAYGGFGSTQDTVVALQALTEFATLASTEVDLTVTIRAGEAVEELRITPQNFDVTQVVELTAGGQVQVEAQGQGQAVIQAVRRYNLPQPEEAPTVFEIAVEYDTTQVAVNDIVGVNVSVAFNPPEPLRAGMVVLDISVPTGFAAVEESLDRLIQEVPKVKRYEVAGRKVILYIEEMEPGERLSLSFQVRALYPVWGKGTVSQAYSYYNPQWQGETLSEGLTIAGE